MLLTEYLPEQNLYMVIPVTPDGKPDPDIEYIFEDEASQATFIQHYFLDPVAAVFAYNVDVEVNGFASC